MRENIFIEAMPIWVYLWLVCFRNTKHQAAAVSREDGKTYCSIIVIYVGYEDTCTLCTYRHCMGCFAMLCDWCCANKHTVYCRAGLILLHDEDHWSLMGTQCWLTDYILSKQKRKEKKGGHSWRSLSFKQESNGTVARCRCAWISLFWWWLQRRSWNYVCYKTDAQVSLK